MFHHRQQIQNQHNFSVAENRSAVHQIRGEGMVVQSFDHQFLFAFQSIHDQAVFSLSHGDNQNKQLAGFPVDVGGGSASETQEWQNLISQLQYFVVIDLMNISFKRERNLAI